MSAAGELPPPLRRARRMTLATAAVLAACVAAASLRSAAWPANLAWTLVLLLPLAAPLPGLVRGVRRTYAWASLCVAPYFIYGVTEVIANPAVRGAAGAVLFASLGWFVALVWYLRLSRGTVPPAQDATGD
ncbi:MAG: DUF2069 domain-containing protein [Steroidobacteraceae bacterium]|nr:DUF2069 domain-containing protein [Steroidobacteraceae bacterium]